MSYAVGVPAAGCCACGMVSWKWYTTSMGSLRFWDRLIGAAAALGVVWLILTRAQPLPPQPLAAPLASAADPAPLVGHLAPDFTLGDLSGAPVRLSGLRGQVVLVNIWATWCPPCRAEMPAIAAVYRQYAAQGFTVLAVNQREEPAAVAAYLQQQGLSFPALLDRDGAVSAAYRAGVLPTTFFIDRRGVIRAIYRGPMARPVIAGTVEQLLAESP